MVKQAFFARNIAVTNINSADFIDSFFTIFIKLNARKITLIIRTTTVNWLLTTTADGLLISTTNGLSAVGLNWIPTTIVNGVLTAKNGICSLTVEN